MMTPLCFTATIKIVNGNPYLLVSQRRAAALKPGWRKPLPVLVRINRKPKTPWRINMMPVGNGAFYLYLHGDVRAASGTKVGNRVNVEVRFDAAYRGGPLHPVPSWFGAALHKNPKASSAWNALAPSRKKEVLRYFSLLKSPQARQRNLQKVLHVLSGEKGRFMARSWNEK
jgi:hypothetical protein